jgi:hypothetical protein
MAVTQGRCDDGAAVHARVQPAADQDLPPPRHTRHGRHGRADPRQEQPPGQRGGPRQGARIVGSATVCTAQSSGSQAGSWQFPKSGTCGTQVRNPGPGSPRFRSGSPQVRFPPATLSRRQLLSGSLCFVIFCWFSSGGWSLFDMC